MQLLQQMNDLRSDQDQLSEQQKGTQQVAAPDLLIQRRGWLDLQLSVEASNGPLLNVEEAMQLKLLQKAFQQPEEFNVPKPSGLRLGAQLNVGLDAQPDFRLSTKDSNQVQTFLWQL